MVIIVAELGEPEHAVRRGFASEVTLDPFE
jgi:hypothetical protein